VYVALESTDEGDVSPNAFMALPMETVEVMMTMTKESGFTEV